MSVKDIKVNTIKKKLDYSKFFKNDFKFDDVEKAKALIMDYLLEDCQELGRIPTITGLALALNTTRLTLLNYQNKYNNNDTQKQIGQLITQAKQIIQNDWETALISKGNTAGIIFNLKNNYGWVDKTEIDQTTKLDATLEVNKMTEKELKDIIKG